MDVRTSQLELQTKGEEDMVNITRQIEEIATQSKKTNGIVNLFAVGSTCAITTVEYENGLLNDLRRTLARLVPRDLEYKHAKAWGDDNAHSHLRASLLGQSLTIPLVNSEVGLGRWQQVVFIELDTRPRRRKVIVQVIGE